jgi:gliding motility associated protien GldN
MKQIKIAITSAMFLVLAGSTVTRAQATLPDSTLRDTLPAYDNFLKATDLATARPFPSARINTANIRLYAITWRDIDLTDSANAMLVIPGNSLMQAIMKSIMAGKLTPYEKDDFKKKLTAKQGELRFADSVLIPVFDKDGNQVSSRMALNEFNPEKVSMYRVKEEVFFDKQRGKVDTRIIGLAPMMQISTSANLAANLSYTPAFWLYFPQLRYMLVQQDVTDPDKQLFDVTMDDVFMQHRFTAYLVMEASPGGLRTGLMEKGSPEALKIEKKLEELKKHIWQSPKGINDNNLVNQATLKKEANHEKASNN